MNERIKELAEQAGLYDEKTPEEVPGFTASFEKFAELIVRECAKFTDYKEELYKHFGVEE